MKKVLTIILMTVLIIGGWDTVLSGLVNEPELPYDPNDIPFAYDPNSCNCRILGTVKVGVNQQFICDVNYYDPDGDGIVGRILAGPQGLELLGSDYDWQLSWIPAEGQVGLHYIDIEIEDTPEYGIPLTDQGTLLIKVYPQNQPPVFQPLCGGR